MAEGLTILASRSFAACPKQQLAQEPKNQEPINMLSALIRVIEDFIEIMWFQVYPETAAGVQALLDRPPLSMKCELTPMRFR